MRPMGTAPNPHPDFDERVRRAHAALRAGRAATAETSLRALEAQCPGEVNCLWLLGVALLDQDKVSESIATLERVLTAAPDFANARVDLARAYRRTAVPPGRARSAAGAAGDRRTTIAPGLRTAMRSSISGSTRMRAWLSSARVSPIRSGRGSR